MITDSLWVSLLIFFGSLFSAIYGLAGGIISLIALTYIYPMREAVALHAAIMLIANASRVAVYFNAISWSTIKHFSPVLIPGVWLGATLVGLLSQQLLLLGLGLFILWQSVSNWIKPPHSVQSTTANTLFIRFASFLTGILGSTIGVTGPFVAIVLIKLGLKKEALIATKSANQIILQLAKIFFFSTLLQFSYSPYQLEILVYGSSVIMGTLLGKIALKKITLKKHQKALAGILFFLGIHIVYKALDLAP